MFNKTALELAREISAASADGTLNAPLVYATAEMLRSQAEVLSGMKAEIERLADSCNTKHSRITDLSNEIDSLKDELQRVYAVVKSHAEITFKAEDERDRLKAKNSRLIDALSCMDDALGNCDSVLKAMPTRGFSQVCIEANKLAFEIFRNALKENV